MKKSILNILAIGIFSTLSTNAFAQESTAVSPLEQGEWKVTAKLPEVEIVDISKMPVAAQQYFMLLSSNILLAEAKNLKSAKEINEVDLVAAMKPFLLALKKTKTDNLPADYKAYMKSMISISEKMLTDLAAIPQNTEKGMEMLIMLMMKYKPIIDALDKKYPECAANAKCTQGSEIGIYKNFKLEDKIQAFTKKIMDKGETDEKAIKIRTMRAAAKTLRKMAAELN